MQDSGVNEKIILTEIGHSSLRMTVDTRTLATHHAGQLPKN